MRVSNEIDLKGILLVVAGAILFSAKAIVVKLAYRHGIDVPSLLLWRMVIAVPIYLTIARFSKRAPNAPIPTRKNVVQVILLGLCGIYVASTLNLFGLRQINASLERLILYVYPTFVLLLGWVHKGRTIAKGEWASLLLTYSGLVVVFGKDIQLGGQAVWLGGLMILGSAAAFAFYTYAGAYLIQIFGALRFTSYAMSSAGLGVGLHNLIRGTVSIGDGSSELGLLIVLFSTMFTIVPSFLISFGIARIGPERTALIGAVGPIVTIVLGSLILGESFTWIHAIGAMFVIGGIVALSLTPRLPQLEVQPK